LMRSASAILRRRAQGFCLLGTLHDSYHIQESYSVRERVAHGLVHLFDEIGTKRKVVVPDEGRPWRSQQQLDFSAQGRQPTRGPASIGEMLSWLTACLDLKRHAPLLGALQLVHAAR
jgi:hypothetical protein